MVVAAPPADARQRAYAVRNLLTGAGDSVRLWDVDHPGVTIKWQRDVALGYGFVPSETLKTLFRREGPAWADGLGRYAGGPTYGVLRAHPVAIAKATEVAGRTGFDVLDPVTVGWARREADRIARGYRWWNVPLALAAVGPVAIGLMGLVAGIVGERPDLVRGTGAAIAVGGCVVGLCTWGRLRVRTAFEDAVGGVVAAYREVVAAMAEAEVTRLGAPEAGRRDSGTPDSGTHERRGR